MTVAERRKLGKKACDILCASILYVLHSPNQSLNPCTMPCDIISSRLDLQAVDRANIHSPYIVQNSHVRDRATEIPRHALNWRRQYSVGDQATMNLWASESSESSFSRSKGGLVGMRDPPENLIAKQRSLSVELFVLS